MKILGHVNRQPPLPLLCVHCGSGQLWLPHPGPGLTQISARTDPLAIGRTPSTDGWTATSLDGWTAHSLTWPRAHGQPRHSSGLPPSDPARSHVGGDKLDSSHLLTFTGATCE